MTVTIGERPLVKDRVPTRIGFVFFSSHSEWQGGLNYFRSLFQALDEHGDSDISVIALVGTRSTSGALGFPDSVTVVRTRSADRGSLFWLLDRACIRAFGQSIFLQRAVRRAGVVVLSHCDPRISPTLPCIAWIPDFQHIRLPSFFKPRELTARDASFKSLLRLADLVVVSSFAARDDLGNFAPQFLPKARVLRFCSVRPELRTNGVGIDLYRVYGIDRPYFFLPNQFWAHKNHALAVQALARLRKRRPNALIVCSGSLSDYRNPNYIESLHGLIVNLRQEESFRILGTIPHEHVARLMLQSVAVINPSLFEGWSTTVEEAKSLGVPLLLSDISVHREQCEHGEALFFSVHDSIGLAHSMNQVLSGRWPSPNPNRVETARNSYARQRRAFALNYLRIVNEITP